MNLFDVYDGEKIAAGKKSYALSFTMRDDNGTMKDSQIEKAMKKLMQAFEKNFSAEIRK